jgi:hypothetical protein
MRVALRIGPTWRRFSARCCERFIASSKVSSSPAAPLAGYHLHHVAPSEFRGFLADLVVRLLKAAAP